MKKFETPAVEIEKFDLADVITTSGTECENQTCENQTPIF